MKNIVVIYHDDLDGFCSALSARRKFRNKAEYIGVTHNSHTPLPEGLVEREIYLFDFCYEKPIMENLLSRNKKLVVIDHHVSEKETIKISTEHIYGENNSASVLAWKYFNPKKPVPRILKYIEDMDYFRFKLPNSKAVFAFLDSFVFDFKIFDKLFADFENNSKLQSFVKEGRAILRYKENWVKIIAAQAEEVDFFGNRAFAVNSPILESEIGNYLHETRGGVAIIWRFTENRFRVSLRSSGDPDVSKLAQKFEAGGGHKQAAGFMFDAEMNFPWTRKNGKSH